MASELDAHEYEVPDRWRYDVTRCKACRVRIVFLQKGSARIPLDVSTLKPLDGGGYSMRSHFLSCPRAASFGRRKKTAKRKEAGGQRQLF